MTYRLGGTGKCCPFGGYFCVVSWGLWPKLRTGLWPISVTSSSGVGTEVAQEQALWPSGVEVRPGIADVKPDVVDIKPGVVGKQPVDENSPQARKQARASPPERNECSNRSLGG